MLLVWCSTCTDFPFVWVGLHTFSNITIICYRSECGCRYWCRWSAEIVYFKA